MVRLNPLRAALFVAGSCMATSAFAQTPYVWTGATSTDYQVGTNWSPTRTTPAATDILNFNGGGVKTVTNLATQAIGELHVTGNTELALTALTSAKTLTINGGANATDFEVAAGSKLRVGGNIACSISLLAAAKGVVDGDIIYQTTAAAVAHKLLGVFNVTAGIIFNSGSTFQFAPGASGGSTPFGTTALNSILFKNGSTFYQGGTTAGASAGSGSSPFGATAPNSVVVFEADSTFYCWWNLASAAGRTYGNLILHFTQGPLLPGGSTTWVVNGDLILRNSGSGTTNFDGAANPVLRVGGDLIMEAGSQLGDNNGGALVAESAVEVKGKLDLSEAGFTPTTNVNRVWKLTGTALQDVEVAAGKTLPALNVNNAAGARLLSNVTVGAGPLTLAAGEVDTNGFTLTAADGAASVARTSGFVKGTLARTVNAAATGVRSFPVGTAGEYAGVDLNITAAGTGTGTVAVTSTATDHANVVDAAGTLDRFWTIASSGVDLSAGAASLTFNYAQADVTGSVVESSLVAGRRTGGEWQVYPATVDTVLNTATVSGVTGFSDWTLGNSAAVPVSISAFAIE